MTEFEQEPNSEQIEAWYELQKALLEKSKTEDGWRIDDSPSDLDKFIDQRLNDLKAKGENNGC